MAIAKESVWKNEKCLFKFAVNCSTRRRTIKYVYESTSCFSLASMFGRGTYINDVTQFWTIFESSLFESLRILVKKIVSSNLKLFFFKTVSAFADDPEGFEITVFLYFVYCQTFWKFFLTSEFNFTNVLFAAFSPTVLHQ